MMEDLQSDVSGSLASTEREFGQPQFEIALVADMCVDLVLRGNVRPRFAQQEQIVDGYLLELGGSANIFATQMAKLGARIGVLGQVGDDLFGDFALRRLTECGVDISLIRRGTAVGTGLGVTLAESDDRAILTVLGSIDSCDFSDLPASPRSLCRHWHVASPFLLRGLQTAWPEFLRLAKENGLTVSLDPNWDPDQRWEVVKNLLPLIDVLLLNESEARALTGSVDAEAAARQLAASCRVTVVKRGSHGAIAVRGDRIWKVAASRVATFDGKPIDTVGAGDNFDAGFLRAWMLGKDVDDCLELGRLCASASLRFAGGIQGQWTGPF